MRKYSKTRPAGWIPSKNMDTIARLCSSFNRGKIYEIFWEYSNLTSETLRQRGARSWLYYENGERKGFALGRHRKGALRMDGAFIFEEVWTPSEGISTELGAPTEKDRKRVSEFRKLLDHSDFKSSPIVLRAASDNQSALMIARTLKAQWVNSLIIAEKRLTRILHLSFPREYEFRPFENGDERNFSRIHQHVFDETVPAQEYKAWATSANCRAIVATCNERIAGFAIAEKRHNGSVGDFSIAVEPNHQRKGVGSTLLKVVLNKLIDMEVKTVIADYLVLNTHAHSLYQKHGFTLKRIYNYFLVHN